MEKELKYEIETENKNLGECFNQKKQKTHKRNLKKLKLNREIKKQKAIEQLLTNS